MYNPDNEIEACISYKVAEHGWGDIAFSQGDKKWESAVSYVMDDSLGNFIRAALFLLGGGESATIRIHTEGKVFDVVATHNSITVIDTLDDEKVVFSAKTPWYNFVAEVLRAALGVKEELGSEGYREKAGLAFPVDDLQLLLKSYEEHLNKDKAIDELQSLN